MVQLKFMKCHYAEEQALFDKSVKTLEDTFDSIKYLLED